MIIRRRDRGPVVLDEPIDLASRIGDHGLSRPSAAAPEIVRRVDGPIESDRAIRSRPTLIGANEAPAAPAERSDQAPVRLPSAAQPGTIGLDEALEKWAPLAAAEPPSAAEAPIVMQRVAPLMGEMDLVVTPLPTPDDWHHFELALRRVPGVGPLRIEYYRAGILKLRLEWTGAQRFADALRTMPEYQVGILGEDKSTVQIRVTRAR